MSRKHAYNKRHSSRISVSGTVIVCCPLADATPLRQATAMSDETGEHSCRVELPANFDHDGGARIDSRAPAARLGDRQATVPNVHPPSIYRLTRAWESREASCGKRHDVY